MPLLPTVIADRNMPGLESVLAGRAQLERVEGRTLTRAQLQHADALLVRSVTRVDAALLEGTPVRYVGSATIGTDHLAMDWLDQAGIPWCHAPGCNADSAAQYTLAMMALACQRQGRDLRDQAVGIIGLGNVGSRLQSLLHTLGIPVVANDPPRQARGDDEPFVDLATALAQPVVSLHVPLTRSGAWPTAGMIDGQALAQLPPDALLVNAARGGVIEGPALAQALATTACQAALDTWPGEPELEPGLIRACTVATPHVAGYALEGKLRGSRAVLEGLAETLGLDLPLPGLPAPQPLHLASEDPLDVVMQATGVARDDAALRNALGPGAERAAAFDRLRRDYPERREFRGLVPRGQDDGPIPARDTLEALGFATS